MKIIDNIFIYCMPIVLLPILLFAGNDIWTSIDGPPGGNCTAVDFVPPPPCLM
jgi:hypothetical protein